jgi:hypothetical protein
MAGGTLLPTEPEALIEEGEAGEDVQWLPELDVEDDHEAASTGCTQRGRRLAAAGLVFGLCAVVAISVMKNSSTDTMESAHTDDANVKVDIPFDEPYKQPTFSSKANRPCGAMNSAGHIVADEDFNNYSSMEAMQEHGWTFSGFEEDVTDTEFKPNLTDPVGNALPALPGSYWGWAYPGTGTLSMTLTGSGIATFDVGNGNDVGYVVAFKERMFLGAVRNSNRRNLYSVRFNAAPGSNITISFAEVSRAILMINYVTFSCDPNAEATGELLGAGDTSVRPWRSEAVGSMEGLSTNDIAAKQKSFCAATCSGAGAGALQAAGSTLGGFGHLGAMRLRRTRRLQLPAVPPLNMPSTFSKDPLTCGAVRQDGTFATNYQVNEFSSLDTMKSNGYLFSDFESDKYMFKPDIHQPDGHQAPHIKGGYWGWSFPGNGKVALRLKGSGVFHVNFGNNNKYGFVKLTIENQSAYTKDLQPHVHHQGHLLGVVGYGMRRTVLSHRFENNQVLEFTEVRNAVLMIQYIRFECDGVDPGHPATGGTWKGDPATCNCPPHSDAIPVLPTNFGVNPLNGIGPSLLYPQKTYQPSKQQEQECQAYVGLNKGLHGGIIKYAAFGKNGCETYLDYFPYAIMQHTNEVIAAWHGGDDNARSTNVLVTNYGANPEGGVVHHRLIEVSFPHQIEKCRAKVGKYEGQDNGQIQYTAYGEQGCHTYLDYFPEATEHHQDVISGAWHMPAPVPQPNILPVLRTNFGVEPTTDVERSKLFKGMQVDECKSKIGTKAAFAGGGEIRYAAFGELGCHAYLDYHPYASKLHEDVITAAWSGNSNAPVLLTNYGLDPAGNAGLCRVIPVPHAFDCMAKLNTNEGNNGGIIQYAAFGAQGQCHTYLGYYPAASTAWGPEAGISAAWHSVSPMTKGTDVLVINYGTDPTDNTERQRLITFASGVLDHRLACKATVNTNVGLNDGRVKYAAFGKEGCHTYLDYYPDATAYHTDDISGAWHLPEAPVYDAVPVQPTNFGVNPETDVERARLYKSTASEAACKSKVGTDQGKDGGFIEYAALGREGCHTYLDYYPNAIKRHDDVIIAAWHGKVDAPVLLTNYGVDPEAIGGTGGAGGRFFAADEAECKSKLNTNEGVDGGEVLYAASGNGRCHLYNHYYPEATQTWAPEDGIVAAWNTEPSSHKKTNVIEINYGANPVDNVRRYRLVTPSSRVGCKSMINSNMGLDNGRVLYAAFGSRGCHTYLDYYPTATALFKDEISAAWHVETFGMKKQTFAKNYVRADQKTAANPILEEKNPFTNSKSFAKMIISGEWYISGALYHVAKPGSWVDGGKCIKYAVQAQKVPAYGKGDPAAYESQKQWCATACSDLSQGCQGFLYPVIDDQSCFIVTNDCVNSVGDFKDVSDKEFIFFKLDTVDPGYYPGVTHNTRG